MSADDSIPPSSNHNGIDHPTTESSKPIGLIYPPAEIRNIVDKTAAYVARTGPQFEDRIRENEKHNPKFCFLNPSDPYRPYYDHKVSQFKSGVNGDEEMKGDEEEGKPEEEEMEGQEGEGKQAKVVEKPPPEEPAPLEFVVEMPSISAQDLDILRLTAQFVARNGRTFMTSLAQREHRNFQFDFLKPNHSLFPYFNKMVEEYTKILVPSPKLHEQLTINATNKSAIYDRVMKRAEWEAYVEEKKRLAQEEEDAEKIAFASIDWHDFVIVETVEFTEADDHIDLPPPLSLKQLESMSLVEKKTAAMISAAQPKPMEIEGDDDDGEMDVEMDEDTDEEEIEKPVVVQSKTAELAGPDSKRRRH